MDAHTPLLSTSPPGLASADVCLFVDGAYPDDDTESTAWVHELLTKHRRLQFHVVCMVADDAPRDDVGRGSRRPRAHSRAALPPNVLSLSHVTLHPAGDDAARVASSRVDRLVAALEGPLQSLLVGGGRGALRQLMQAMSMHGAATGEAWIDAPAAYALMQRMYERGFGHTSFVHYAASWRVLVGGIDAVLRSRLPNARTYHALSTGHAGLAMARAVIATGRPGVLTELDASASAQQIAIALTDGLRDTAAPDYGVDRSRGDLRALWTQALSGYARAAYESANRIIALVDGQQPQQERDGAARTRMMVVPRGVDVKRFRAIQPCPDERRPTVALIAPVVPGQDIKTFIRAVSLLRDMVPNVRAWIVGATHFDISYHQSCADMIRSMQLEDTLELRGVERMDAVLPQVDVLALTSLDETQPLRVLQAGAAGIACVVTDVGACRSIIHGRDGEYPSLSSGGMVTPLVDPRATAQAIAQLLHDDALRARCGRALRERVRRYYNQKLVNRTYRQIYAEQTTTLTALAGAASGRPPLIVDLPTV